MPHILTTLQRSLLERLNILGMADLADRAQTAWSELRAYPCALTPVEQSAMEGESLCHDFKLANKQARAAMSRA